MAPVETLAPVAPPDPASILEYKTGQRIYQRGQTPADLYLVLAGKVKLCRALAGGRPVVVDVISPGGVFGESALLNLPQRVEEAAAMEHTTLMAYPAGALRNLLGESGLGLNFIQAFAQRAMESAHRIESLSIDAVDRRLAWSLVRFAERLGTREADGVVRILPLTHEFLAQYIGTSRENVTRTMIRFRRQGYLRYSRQAIRISYDALISWLGQPQQELQPAAAGD
jgi:CRP/FNR family transcriptional regulator, cyclic AMP receptor protein